jgi:hypothetical protein
VIYDLYQVFDRDDLKAQQIVGHEPGEVTRVEWPEWVWHGIQSLGWDIKLTSNWRDTTQFEPMSAHPPNWREVAEALHQAMLSPDPSAAMDRYRTAAMEQAAYDERTTPEEPDAERDS